MRLFIAADLPAPLIEGLQRVQPASQAGVRVLGTDQLHLTLHFIGEADLDRIDGALRSRPLPAVSLGLDGVGQFASSGGSTTLWAGIRETPELLALHAEVAATLSTLGFRPEAKRFAPHITIARCESSVPAQVSADFVARHASLSTPAVPLTQVSVYSSEFVRDVPRYRRERSYPVAGR